ncbi:MAG: YesL family protein [Lachnospiraceae bacterium]|nr:YesL family protein [Lachnospiraceae bacterium]
MPDRIFDIEGPLVQFIFRVKDLFVLNILTLVCCIPVFTIGPALKALAFTSLKMVRKEDGNVVTTYFKNFKLNFRQTVGFGLICLALLLICAGDIFMVFFAGSEFPMAIRVLSMVAVVAVISILLYAIPMQGRFLNPIKVTFRNAFWAAIVKFPRTLLMLLSYAFIPALWLFVSGNFFPLIPLFGLSLPAYICALIYDPFFRETENAILEAQKEKAASPEEEPLEEPIEDSIEDSIKDSKES